MPSVAWALQERDAKGADSSTKEGHLIPMRRGGFFDAPIAFHPSQDPISSTDGSTHALGCGSKQGQSSVAIAFSCKDSGADATNDCSPTLRSGNAVDGNANGGVMPAVAFKTSHFTRGKDGAPSEVFPPLSADVDKGDQCPVIGTRWGVRRLTPTECERLQGFPDGHTAGFSDSTRYRMMGNAVCVECAEWIGKRLVRAIAQYPNGNSGTFSRPQQGLPTASA